MANHEPVASAPVLPRGEAAALLRRERQAAALRANLARRKAQLRIRNGQTPPADDTAPPDTGVG